MSHNRFSTKPKQYYRGPCPYVTLPSQKYRVTENVVPKKKQQKHSQITVEMHKQLDTVIREILV